MKRMPFCLTSGWSNTAANGGGGVEGEGLSSQVFQALLSSLNGQCKLIAFHSFHLCKHFAYHHSFNWRNLGDWAVAKQPVGRSGSTGEAWGQLEKQSLLLLCLPHIDTAEVQCLMGWDLLLCCCVHSVGVRVIPGTGVLAAPHICGS